ncbi:MAG: hypothetical protein AAGE52_28650, partial [Myxococcota bacterium]
MKRCVLLLFVVACGDDSSAPDAATDAGRDTDVADAAPPDAGTDDPAPPAPPAWTCPARWSAVEVAGSPTCMPPSAPTDCGDGETRWIDSAGCVEVAACPDGEFADVAATIYVRPGAFGDGSEDDPLGDFETALALAIEGDVIALAPGTYDGSFRIPNGVRVVGACPEATRLVWSTATPDRPVVLVNATQRGALENVTVGPAATVGILAAGDTELRGVVVEDVVGAGILVDDLGRLDAERIAVRDVGLRDGRGGQGVIVSGGQAEGSHWTVRRCVRAGVFVDEGATVSVDDLVSGAHTGVTSIRRSGVYVRNASFSGARIDLREATNTALEVEGGGATVRDLIVDDVTIMDPPGGMAVWLHDGGSLDIDGAFVRSGGWLISGERADQVTVRNATLRGETGGFLWGQNVGVSLIDTAATLERIAIDGADSGILVNGPFDFTLPPLDGDPPPDEPPVDPIAFNARDIRIGRIADGVRFGYGLRIDVPIVAEVERLEIESVRGILIDVGGSLTLADAVLRDPQPGRDQEGRESFGVGMTLNDEDASADLRRATIENMFDVGIEARGGSLTLEDVRITNTQERPCGDTTCPGAPGGTAVGAYFDAVLRATNLEVQTAALCGVQFAFGGEVDLTGGRIENATVGVCVQVEDYDVSRLTNGVVFDNNGT